MANHSGIIDQANVYGGRQQLHAVSFQQSDGFQKLNEKLRDIATSLVGGLKTFDAMKISLQGESGSTKEHVSREFRQREKHVTDDDHCRRFLESL